MKISKSKLRQIIKEELNNVLSEQGTVTPDNPQGLRWSDLNPFDWDDDEPVIRGAGGEKLADVPRVPGQTPAQHQATREAGLKAAADDPNIGVQNIRRRDTEKWKEKQGGGAGRAQAGGDWCTANPPLTPGGPPRPLSAQQVIKIVKAEGHYTGDEWWKTIPASEPIYAQYKAWWRCAKPEDKRYLGPPGRGKPGPRKPDDALPEEWEVGKCVHDHPDYPGESVMANAEGEIVPCEEVAACENQDIMYDAMALYEAMKGMGTDEEAIYRVLEKNADCECMKELYAAYDKILEVKDDTDSGDLIDWLRDDGEYKSAAQVKQCMMGQDVRQIDTEWR